MKKPTVSLELNSAEVGYLVKLTINKIPLDLADKIVDASLRFKDAEDKQKQRLYSCAEEMAEMIERYHNGHGMSSSECRAILEKSGWIDE